MTTLPDDETGNALKEYLRDGSDLMKPMTIDFFIAVPSNNVGDEIALVVKKLGFITSVEKDEESGEWTCYCTKTLIPEYEEVVKIEKILSDIAKAKGGFTDGFGSYGNA